MQSPPPQPTRRRSRFWSAATLLLVVLLLAHPELRLLVPLVDAIGLDVLITLTLLQLSAFASGSFRPVLERVWTKTLPLLHWLNRVSSRTFPLSLARGLVSYGVFHWLGRPGPRLWFTLHGLARVALAGPRA